MVKGEDEVVVKGGEDEVVMEEKEEAVITADLEMAKNFLGTWRMDLVRHRRTGVGGGVGAAGRGMQCCWLDG